MSINSEFMVRVFSSPHRVRFDTLTQLAGLVAALADYHSWLGVRVLDDLLESVRLALEVKVNRPASQQRLFTAIHFLGHLYNFNVCSTATLFHVCANLFGKNNRQKSKNSNRQKINEILK
jgi:hypothetical protein